MFCTKCGEEIAPGTKFCTRCGTPVEEQQQSAIGVPSVEESNYSEPTTADDKSKSDDSDSEGWLGGLFTIVIVAAIIWGLVHFNPTEEQQAAKVKETLKEQVAHNPENVFAAGYVMKNLKYKDFWVVSWTYVEPDGYFTRSLGITDNVLCSVGFCGIVIPIIEIL